MKHHPLKIALAVLLTVAFVLAQDTKSLDRGARNRGDTLEKFETSDGEGKPDEVRNDPHAPRGGARGYCTFKGSVQPRRIAPGASGTLVITMIMQGNWVMRSPANMAFEFEPQQGAISLGQPVLRPARPGTLETALKGFPVYDHYAIIDVPISVAANARYGEHQVRVRALFDIADGRSGEHFQRFMDTCGGKVEVGEPVPENLAPRLQSGPEAEMRPIPQPGEATTPTVAPVGAGEQPRAAPTPSGQVLPVDDGVTVGETPDVVSLETTYGNGADSAGVSWTLVLGIAGFGLVLVVLAVGLLKRG